MSTKIDTEIAAKLRQGFKFFNKFILLMWRLGMGVWFNLWPEGWGQIMVITHSGRKTGTKYHTPVNYAIIDGQVYCIAGFGAIADWYRNTLANPEVEVWLSDGWWSGIAEEASEAENRRQIMRAVIEASGFAATLFGVNPQKLNDDALARVTEYYKIIRILRGTPRTGPGGPGELAWVWQVATFILLPLVLFRRRRK